MSVFQNKEVSPALMLVNDSGNLVPFAPGSGEVDGELIKSYDGKVIKPLLLMVLDDDGSLRPATAADFGSGGGEGPSSIAWGNVTGKPAVIAAGEDAAAARTAIGAGTSSQNLPTLTAAAATTGTATAASAITAAVLAGAVNERTKGKAQIAALTPIADTATADVEDVATLLNGVIAALKA